MNCPHCRHEVSPTALMCAFCERSLPRRAPPRAPAVSLRALGQRLLDNSTWLVLACGVISVLVILVRWWQPWAVKPMASGDLEKNAGRLQETLQRDRLSASELDFVYSYVRGLARDKTGLTVTSPITPHWVPRSEIQQGRDPEVVGYTEATLVNSVLMLAIYVPDDEASIPTVHTIAHELGHCWLADNRVQAPKPKAEGFCEWVAWHVLDDLPVSDARLKFAIDAQIHGMRKNMHADYSRGFEYLEQIEKSGGSDAVFKEMLSNRP